MFRLLEVELGPHVAAGAPAPVPAAVSLSRYIAEDVPPRRTSQLATSAPAHSVAQANAAGDGGDRRRARVSASSSKP